MNTNNDRTGMLDAIATSLKMAASYRTTTLEIMLRMHADKGRCVATLNSFRLGLERSESTSVLLEQLQHRVRVNQEEDYPRTIKAVLEVLKKELASLEEFGLASFEGTIYSLQALIESRVQVMSFIAAKA